MSRTGALGQPESILIFDGFAILCKFPSVARLRLEFWGYQAARS
jgi:hypothetical protein